MSDNLTRRLLAAESDFLTALGHTETLASYIQTWTALLDTIRTASMNGSVNHETLSLAHSVASRVASLSSCFLDIKRLEESYTNSLRADCDTMLRQMAALDLNADKGNEGNDTCSRQSSGTPNPSAEISTPPFVAAAHQWLVDNLHNPYPTAEVKARIAATSSCQVSSINSWFINARRRIGWTSLCRGSFSNCRADTIDAAYRALVEEDPQRALSPEHRHSFIAMKVAAENLYLSTFTRSAFVGDLDTAEKDATRGRKEFVETECWHVDAAKTAEDSYPSPARSVVGSPVPALDVSLTDESEEEEEAAPPILAGSKRHRSSFEPENQLPPASKRPIKRLRASITSQTHLPSPSSSTDGIELPPDASSPSVVSERLTQSETSNALPPRKQYVSDVDDSVIPKRLGGLTAVPRLHTIPDPLPCSNIGNESVNDWFNPDFDALFAIPPPVDAVEPDFSASWEVKLFKDYSIPENSIYAPKWPPITDMNVSAATRLSEFDSLFQSIVGDTYVAPSGNMLSSNITVDPHTAFLDSSVPDMSHIDWTSLLDGSDAYQSTVDSTLSQSTVSQPLPDIDLSMLQFRPLTPTVQSHGDLASTRAKLDQLHAMQEAVRQMERELQSEGVIL